MLERIKKLLHIGIQRPEDSKEDYLNKFYESLAEDIIRIELGSDLCAFSGAVVDICDEVRTEIKNETGFVVPLIHIIGNEDLQENQYRIIIREDLSYDFYAIPNEQETKIDIRINLENICRENIESIFSSKVLEGYINIVNRNSCNLVWDLFRVYTENDIKTILINLIREGYSIKNITSIFEKINQYMLKDGDWCRIRSTDEVVGLICSSMNF